MVVVGFLGAVSMFVFGEATADEKRYDYGSVTTAAFSMLALGIWIAAFAVGRYLRSGLLDAKDQPPASPG